MVRFFTTPIGSQGRLAKEQQRLRFGRFDKKLLKISIYGQAIN